MAAAATRATFSDFRIVKGRKVAQLVFEVPLEGADAALAALGGLPQPAAERWCGIARLTDEAAHKPDARERYAQSSEGKQAVTRAALLCSESGFQGWIGVPPELRGREERASEGAMMLRARLGIGSRQDIAADPDALKRFLDLEARFKSETRFGPHATR